MQLLDMKNITQVKGEIVILNSSEIIRAKIMNNILMIEFKSSVRVYEIILGEIFSVIKINEFSKKDAFIAVALILEPVSANRK